MHRCGLKQRLAQALSAAKFEVRDDKKTPLSIQSHCAGLDAVALSCRALGLTVTNVASECDPNAALAHMFLHRKTDHLITDIR